jgi:hypothetical protein
MQRDRCFGPLSPSSPLQRHAQQTGHSCDYANLCITGKIGSLPGQGGERIANIPTIIETAKLHGHNPEAYLTDVLTRIQSHPKDRLEELLPWQWTPSKDR